ncbi:TonB-dependent receptor plug domain-containing protein [Aliikangiella coralliicola]|uniref:TonB-dependent receptor n=1 Tax=Aliikangiella coralliicola TaxID=2592383 RepID=A0A545U7M9_9GAMM|nr:TonB-dependent receptor [Aliikangiella coralliicola]TQV85474.1 TonB-dependent receptor [Aliikangiella coralliicola]
MKVHNYSPISKAVRSSIAALGIAILAVPGVQAAEESEDDQKIVITGSRIKRIDAQGASPVVVITREDMDNQGYSTLQDALDSLAQNTGGSVDQSFTFGFVPGASSVNLRGFGNGRSLTLIDGKRIPIYPVANSGTSNFVDLSAIPASMIERVEILTDGASAIYGSDAISGVINVITRKDFEGTEVSVRLGDTSDGGYQNERVSVVAGATSGKTTVNVIAEYQHNDELAASQRDYAASDLANPRGVLSSGGASFQAVNPDFSTETIAYPLCGDPNDPLGSRLVNTGIPGDFCRYNRTQHRQLFPENERAALSVRVDREFTPDLSGYVRAGFSTYETRTNLEPNYYNAWWGGQQPGSNLTTVAPSAAGTVLAGTDFGFLADGSPDYIWGLVPAGSANNPTTGTANERDGFFRRRLFEFGDRTGQLRNDGVNVLIGLEGSFGDAMYDWEASISYNKIRFTNKRRNIISSSFNNAVTNGLDLFQIIPQSVIDSVSFDSLREAESDNFSADFQISGELPFELSGGNAQFAVFSDFQRESFFNTADPISLAGDAFDGSSAGAGERDHTGIGFEIALPVTDQLEVDIAVRHDNYDDASETGSAVSPRIAVTYRPIEELMLRFTAGESFRAPDMQRLFGATTSAFQTVNDPNFCLDPNNPGVRIPIANAFCSTAAAAVWREQSVPLTTGSNIALQEEEGENYNFGIVWQATDDLDFSMDIYNIRLEEIVNTPTPQFIIDSCDQNGIFCENISRNPQGVLANIAATARNLSFQEILGADFTVNYKLTTEQAGEFKFKGELAYVDSFETQFNETSPVVENTGIATQPDYRFNLTVDWTRDNWGATVRYVWVDEMCGVNGVNCTADEFIDTYALTNISGRYDFGDAGRVSLGINNVFNEDPAEDPTNNNWPWFFNNGGYSNPIGREYSVTYTVSF